MKIEDMTLPELADYIRNAAIERPSLNDGVAAAGVLEDWAEANMPDWVEIWSDISDEPLTPTTDGETVVWYCSETKETVIAEAEYVGVHNYSHWRPLTAYDKPKEGKE